MPACPSLSAGLPTLPGLIRVLAYQPSGYARHRF